MDLYLIPGLGADHRLFERCDFGDHRVIAFDWPSMPEGSTLNDFARTLAEKVDAGAPHALIGVSMGGMVAQEMAAMTHPQKVIIISSWKGPQEMPLPIRLLRSAHAERLLTPAFFQRFQPIARWQLGVESPDEQGLFGHFLAVTPLAQLRAQVGAALGWEGAPPHRLVHIHGDQDRLMPIANIVAPIVVKGGTHMMVFSRAEEVSTLVRSALSA